MMMIMKKMKRKKWRKPHYILINAQLKTRQALDDECKSLFVYKIFYFFFFLKNEQNSIFFPFFLFNFIVIVSRICRIESSSFFCMYFWNNNKIEKKKPNVYVGSFALLICDSDQWHWHKFMDFLLYTLCVCILWSLQK